jgi:hypothetical protein
VESDFRVRRWDLKTSKEQRAVQLRPDRFREPGTEQIERDRFAERTAWSSFTFSPDGRAVVLRAPMLLGQQVAVLDTGTGKQRYKLEAGGTRIHTAFSADGKLIVIGAEDGVVHLAEASTGRERLRLRQRGPVTAVALSADSRLIAAAAGREGSTVRLWEVATGQEVLQLAGQGAEVTYLAFAPDGKSLATGCYDSTALIWSLAPGGRSPGRVVTELNAKGIERLWADLADGDGPRAYAAVWGLASAPGQAIPFLRQQLKPAAEIDRNRLRQLLGDLDKERFAVREAAMRELEGLGEDAAPALRQALAGKRSLEVRRRLEELLSRAKVLRPGERLRGVRAVEVLERIGTLEAKHLLKKLAEGAPEAQLTREAKASLQRLAKRAAANR